MQTRGIVETSGLTRGVRKIGDAVEFKGSCSGIPREQAHLINQNLPENRQTSGFLSLAFYSAPSLRTVDSSEREGGPLKIAVASTMGCAASEH